MLAYRQFGGAVGRNAPTETAFTIETPSSTFCRKVFEDRVPTRLQEYTAEEKMNAVMEIVHLSLDLAGEARILLG